ncbi:hypothetical protein [Neolewinella litorea]|uniref:Uncharacterized protein n=1 Tax=Neolewinella litorea TaxID=2562452 RepID=A0A4S4N7Q6_9BACT|nr:hypothetical protein [Neolewinella litorea]THH34575.1 hypothetical protein E4021_17435 [Neolewinella litorea]
MKKFTVIVGGILACLPWINEITALNLLPDYWHYGSEVINVVVSVLCFAVVGLLYINRLALRRVGKTKIIVTTAVSFLLFAGAFLGLLLIRNHTYFTVSDCCIYSQDDGCVSHKVFVPLFKPPAVADYPRTELEMSWQEWIALDQCFVNEELTRIGGDDILASFTYTMLLLSLLYLLTFIFLILAVVPLGLYASTDADLDADAEEPA